MSASDSPNESDAAFMRLALKEAESALESGEVPVGCVIIDARGEVLSTGFNKTNHFRNGTRHAELVAMDKLILYVTCEPCIMCAAALSKVGIQWVYFGCHNDRFGGNGSILSVHNTHLADTRYGVCSGLLAGEAVALFQRFYESENRRAPESKRRKKGPRTEH
ncbi:tRNA specific adenosine deaminase [Ochromonadaceae sp. CCMP2298]|nr:tRNA specific adenosine deaminase [Ochromonadaceae sp. CCMP2298]